MIQTRKTVENLRKVTHRREYVRIGVRAGNLGTQFGRGKVSHKEKHQSQEGGPKNRGESPKTCGDKLREKSIRREKRWGEEN